MKNISYLAIAVWVIATKFTLGFISYPPPTFKSDWITLTNHNSSTSYRVIAHGLNEVPIIAKVLVKVTDGPNKDYIFEAVGSAYTDNGMDVPRGGVIFAYTSSSVHVWSATPGNLNNQSYPVLMGGTWGSGNYAQTTDSVLIQVQAWSGKGFYDPDFVSDEIVMGTRDTKVVKYNFAQTPAIVKVVGKFETNGETWFFVGTGVQQGSGDRAFIDVDHTGGMHYAYSSRSTRVWTKVISVFSSARGWGHDANEMSTTTASVRVYSWRPWECLNPLFDSGWFDVNQTAQTFYELTYGECNNTRHVDVELLAVDGANQGFIFKGVGMAQILEKRRNNDIAGGVVFAHSTSAIRLWATYSPSDPGRSLIAVRSYLWDHQQLSYTAKLRVRVWCENGAGTPRWVPSGMYLTATGDLTLHPPLMTMGSANASLVQCVAFCKRTTCCTYISVLDGVCTIYGELQFGKTSARPDSRGLYYFNNNPCED